MDVDPGAKVETDAPCGGDCGFHVRGDRVPTVVPGTFHSGRSALQKAHRDGNEDRESAEQESLFDPRRSMQPNARRGGHASF